MLQEVGEEFARCRVIGERVKVVAETLTESLKSPLTCGHVPAQTRAGTATVWDDQGEPASYQFEIVR